MQTIFNPNKQVVTPPPGTTLKTTVIGSLVCTLPVFWLSLYNFVHIPKVAKYILELRITNYIAVDNQLTKRVQMDYFCHLVLNRCIKHPEYILLISYSYKQLKHKSKEITVTCFEAYCLRTNKELKQAEHISPDLLLF